jgi:hypothetical protein
MWRGIAGHFQSVRLRAEVMKTIVLHHKAVLAAAQGQGGGRQRCATAQGSAALLIVPSAAEHTLFATLFATC